MFAYRLISAKVTMVVLLSLLSLANALSAKTIYVNHSAQGSHNGSNWHNALTSLQSALKIAKKGDVIWVAKGHYYPSHQGNRRVSFVIPDFVKVLGGFSGKEKSAKQRNYIKNVTVLDGDIRHNQAPETYSFRVVMMGSDALLDGFTVENGHDVPSPRAERQGQIAMNAHSPQLIQGFKKTHRRTPLPPPPQGSMQHTTPMAISNQLQQGAGAGVVNYNHAGVVKNCIIQNNVALKGAGSYNRVQGETAVYLNVRFQNNEALKRGAAMANDLRTKTIIINSHFDNNQSDNKGGAIYNDFSSLTLVVNTFVKNNDAARAATIANDGGSKTFVVNSVLTDNTAKTLGAALYQGSYNANITNGYNQMVVINSRIENNQSQTAGPRIFIWGNNRYDIYRSTVPAWHHPIAKEIPKNYQSLLTVADNIKRQQPTQAEMKSLLDFIDYQSEQQGKISRGRPSFRNTNAVAKKNFLFPERIYYVNRNNHSQQQNGLSWHTAYRNLQQAINVLANHGGGQIWVAKGNYYPNIDKQQPRLSSFHLQTNVAIYGGFSGDENSFEQRHLQKNKVILNGNIGKLLHNSLHSYHVIIGANNSLLDDVTVTGGQALGQGSNAYGGGLLMLGQQQTVNVKNAIFTANKAYYGGAIYAFNNVSSYFYEVKIIGNQAAMGAGIYLSFGSNIHFDLGMFAHNSARYRGGAAVVNYGSNPYFDRTTFRNNSTQGNGGAVWIDDQASQFGSTEVHFRACQFQNNQAHYYGGAIAAVNNGRFSNKNSQFDNNRAQRHDDVYVEGTQVLPHSFAPAKPAMISIKPHVK